MNSESQDGGTVESEVQLGLAGRVERAPLENLLLGKSSSGIENPGGDWRGGDMPAGWIVSMEVNRHHRTLWACGDKETRLMTEVVHGFAVRSNLDRLDRALRGAGGFGVEDSVGAAYAVFDTGTGPGQMPGLRSTVIIPQGHLRDDRSVMTFPSRMMGNSERHLGIGYKSEFLPRAYHVFGRVGFGEADVPKGLFRPLSEDPAITGGPNAQTALVFGGEDIFTQWQRQAQFRGFGADEVAEVLRSARAEAWKIGKPEDFDRPRVAAAIQSMAQKLWNCCMGSHEHSGQHRETEKDHRPSM